MIEPIRGADFQTRGLLLALKAGEPSRIAQGSGHGGRVIARPRGTTTRRSPPSCTPRKRSPRRLDSPYLRGMVAMVRGAALLMQGQWRPACRSLDQAEQLFRNRCTGVTWERDTVHNFMLWALIQLGEIAELKRRWTVLYRESQERGDLYARHDAHGLLHDHDHARPATRRSSRNDELEAFVDRRDQERFNLQHSSAFESLIHLYLYRGDVSNAWARLIAIWPAYSRSMLLAHQDDPDSICTSCGAGPRWPWRKKPSIHRFFSSQAHDDARSLEREGQPWALAHAHYLKAGIAACEGDSIRAIRELTLAVEDYDRAEMPLRAQILRFRLGEIQSDIETRAIHDKAEQWITGQGIVSPARWAGMYAPGFLKISTESIETSYLTQAEAQDQRRMKISFFQQCHSARARVRRCKRWRRSTGLPLFDHQRGFSV